MSSIQQLCEEIAARVSEGETRLAAAEQLSRVLEERLAIMQRRLDHTDIELAQARDSRDGYKARLEALLAKLEADGYEVDFHDIPKEGPCSSSQDASAKP